MTSEATPLASTAGVAVSWHISLCMYPLTRYINLQSRKQRFIRVARLLVAVVSKRFHRKQTLEEAVTSDLCSGAHCLCENPDIVSFECDRVSYDVLLANDDALKLFATVVSTRRCSSLAAASVLTFMAKTLTDESSLESVASTLSDVVELCLCQLSRDCVESLLSEIPPHASLHYLTTTLLPRMDFECLHSVQVLELWDDVVEAGESFRSLTHLKLNDLSWSSVAASLENLALSTQLVALCVALKHRGPAHTPVCFRMVFPRLKYLEIDEAGLPVRGDTYSCDPHPPTTDGLFVGVECIQSASQLRTSRVLP